MCSFCFCVACITCVGCVFASTALRAFAVAFVSGAFAFALTALLASGACASTALHTLLAIPGEFAVEFASTALHAFIALCAFALNCIACVSCVIMETRHKARFPQNNAMQRNEMQSGFHKIRNTT